MGLNQLSSTIRNNNLIKGFELEDVQIGTQLMLVVSELGEALEAERKGKHCPQETITDIDDDLDCGLFNPVRFENEVKDSFEDEMADSIIRLLDICAFLHIDIDAHIRAKLKYNMTREYKHGKKF